MTIGSCPETHSPAEPPRLFDRRHAGRAGADLADLLRLESRAAETSGAKASKAKSVLHIFCPADGPSGIFDPAVCRWNTGAPSGVKTAPGEVFCETGPDGRRGRSVDSGPLDDARRGAHEPRDPQHVHRLPPQSALVYPSLGSVVSHELGPRADLPPYICIPNQPNPYAGTGYLSSSFGPSASPIRLEGVQGPRSHVAGGSGRSAILPARTALRRSTRTSPLEKSTRLPRWTAYDRAYGLISSPKAREAFNLDAEPAAIREEYGHHQAGQRLLMARRLIAAGVRSFR